MDIHQLQHEVQQTAHETLFTEHEMVVAFGLAHFPGPFYLGFISFPFPDHLSFYPLSFLLGYTLFIFFLKFFDSFKNMENLCSKKRYVHIAELIQSIMKYDTYWYRSITTSMLMLFPTVRQCQMPNASTNMTVNINANTLVTTSQCQLSNSIHEFYVMYWFLCICFSEVFHHVKLFVEGCHDVSR